MKPILAAVLVMAILAVAVHTDANPGEPNQERHENDQESACELGRRYLTGDGVPVDTPKAVEVMLRGLEEEEINPFSRGTREGCTYLLGKLCAIGVPMELGSWRAALCLEQAAAAGCTEAQYVLGVRCYHGAGIPKDTVLGVHRLERAAMNDPVAGWMLESGLFRRAPHNYADAVQCLVDSSAAGNALAHSQLMVMYKAQWDSLPQQERVVISFLSGELNPFDLPDSVWRSLFSEYRTEICRLAEIAGPQHQFLIGMVYRCGLGVEVDPARAAEWFRMAADSGHPGAQALLGDMYGKGEGFDEDHKEAIRWYLLAAEQGLAAAQKMVGAYYAAGYGVPQDYQLAVMWLRKAAEQGDPGGQLALGHLYHDGLGVAQDYVMAHMWFNLAGAQNNLTARQERDRMARDMTPAQIAEAQRLAGEWRPLPDSIPVTDVGDEEPPKAK